MNKCLLLVVLTALACVSPYMRADDKPINSPAGPGVAVEPLKPVEPPAAAKSKMYSQELAKALARPVSNHIYQGEDIRVVLSALGTAADVTIIADPDVTGTVDVALNNSTLHGALRAVCVPLGYYFSEDAGGWITVRKKRMVIFSVNYPQMTRNGTSTASVTINSGNSKSGGGSTGGSIISTGSGGGASGSGGSNDSTQFSINQQNQANFWDKLESRIKSIVAKDETVMVDAFSGLVTVEAGQRTITKVHDLIDAVNIRIGSRVDIMCRILEVTTSDQEKMGIDWQAVGFNIGGTKNITVGASAVSPSTGNTISGITASTNMTSTGQFSFNPDTITGTIGWGKVEAVVQALKEQGNVRQVSNPRLSTLNNQTAYIKDGIDRPFFSLSSHVTITTTSSTSSTPITENQYSKETYAIGTALQVTPQADGDLVTLDLSPAITRLQEIITSPDGSQTAPVLQNKQTGIIVRVKSGETAIVGGLITETNSKTGRKIPGLGDIPYLGRLFSSEGTAKGTTELVIFLTPTIVRYESKDCTVSDPIGNIDVPLKLAPREVDGFSF